MLIANPIYDTAFKQVLRDPEVAKSIIGTLMNTEVLELNYAPTEHNKPLGDKDTMPRFFRMDFACTIKTEDGSQKILIEMQKAVSPDEELRFREYLAVAGYMPQPQETTPLPVTTIYFLGFNLKGVKTPCLKVKRQYYDMINETVLETKNRFIELLTHDAYIVQTGRIHTDDSAIPKKPKSKLEEILSVFEQKNFTANEKEAMDFKGEVESPSMKRMLDILHHIATDPEERKKLDEEAYWARYDRMGAGQILELQDALKAKDAELSQKDQAHAAAFHAAKLASARTLKALGKLSAEEIAKATGLGVGEVEGA
jgi:flagellar biosynthesis/type III secretory pathway protein FliH